MIIRSVITQTAYGHLNLFDSIKRKKKKKEGKLKKKDKMKSVFHEATSSLSRLMKDYFYKHGCFLACQSRYQNPALYVH